MRTARNYQAEWALRNAARMKLHSKINPIKLKLETLQAYGGTNPECFCCHEDTLEFLTLEHPGGIRQKGEPRGGGLPVYRWLKLHGFPGDYKVACFNCNMAISSEGGVCPHTSGVARPRLAKRNARIRQQVLSHYSDDKLECACCQEHEYSMLSLDHIHGGGRRHLAKVRSVYDWIVQQNFPSGFRVLCNNCNNAIGAYGYCPHQSDQSMRTELKRLQIQLQQTPPQSQYAVGSCVGTSKLKAYQVKKIKSLFPKGNSKKALARQFLVSATTIRRILAGEIWAHV